MVTFSYKEREQPEVRWTLPVEKFISLLIWHISPGHFRVVRYYGALATRGKSHFKRVWGKLFGRLRKVSKSAFWRERFLSFTRGDPLRCPLCQREMKLVEVAYPKSKSGKLVSYYPT